MNGQQWKENKGWLQHRLTCEWYGVSCSYLERICEIRLPNNGVKGTLPTQLGRMPFLRVLDISYNHEITGTLPIELIGNPSILLHEVDVSSNQLSGTIPDELLESGFVDRLNLSNNSIRGTIPSQIGRLYRLKRLSLDHNQLTGPIPSELGLLSNLEIFEIDSNRLTGTLPLELSHLSNLEQMDMSRNYFSGTVPSFIGYFPHLETLFLHKNRIVGAVPESFCNVSSSSLVPFSVFLVSCTGNYSVTSTCSCCNKLGSVQCYEWIPPSLQKEF
eukprot:CAMPEP_0202479720 /NCGR_PEP_ID=MMETSP1360-20130828/95131_1 /ASSEMBLY_ACC=CAM_ASM_000848 /TAXON_ID=515479 /ORGANISM="Licmophora paradoxa, Strain CCMP2313" /LENGTH=272 /DNA_ID=CAMNT_0049107063 /DNA_START=463 /DNA_END=1281 /DNA_ORIENTATION=+